MRPLASPQTMTGEPSGHGVGIEIDGVGKTYSWGGRDVLALQPVDVALAPGEFVSIVGPSGCGKSTLMLMVAGLLETTTGEIRVDGSVLTSPMTDVGIVFQDDLLLEFRTTLDNVLLQSDIRRRSDRATARETAVELLGRLGLAAAIDRYPNQLSGGMRQRVSLARGLVHDPPVLLMDEPFGALDAITRTQMRRDLEALWIERPKTVLFITHGVEEAVGLSDRVVVMSPGPGQVVDDIRVELPRPRPVELGDDRAFTAYTDRIYSRFREYGVLH
jgi:NitT/TauT family transport system ATP-binding protein